LLKDYYDKEPGSAARMQSVVQLTLAKRYIEAKTVRLFRARFAFIFEKFII